MKLKGQKKTFAFEKFRKEGIFKYNMEQSKEKEPNYQQERRSNKDNSTKVACSNCKGFYQSGTFFRHKNNCNKYFEAPAMALTNEDVSVLDSVSISQEFKKNVLSSFWKDDVSRVIKNDEFILVIGNRLFQKTKKRIGKEVSTIKTVLAELRRIARLYIIFTEMDIDVVHNNILDMFRRKNFEYLRVAIDRLTTSDEDEFKHGLKYNLKFTLSNGAKILKGTFLSS